MRQLVGGPEGADGGSSIFHTRRARHVLDRRTIEAVETPSGIRDHGCSLRDSTHLLVCPVMTLQHTTPTFGAKEGPISPSVELPIGGDLAAKVDRTGLGKCVASSFGIARYAQPMVPWPGSHLECVA